MLGRMQTSIRDKDQGFTLIELLVVIVIIGILAAIAIPVFLSQRQKGLDASLKSDLKNAATTLETKTADAVWTSTADQLVTEVATDLELSPGNVLNFVGVGNSSAGYCMQGTNSGTSETWYYSSTGGGMQPKGTTACP